MRKMFLSLLCLSIFAGSVFGQDLSGCWNIALNKTYQLDPAPHANYPDSGNELTDGIIEYTMSSQVGWVNVASSSVTIDLEQVTRGSYAFEAYFMSRPTWSVYLPEDVQVSLSLDGVDYQNIGSLTQLTNNTDSINKYQLIAVNIADDFRYVRFDIDSVGAWFMCCETSIVSYPLDVSDYMNLALSKDYTLNPAPHANYPDSGGELTDGEAEYSMSSQVGWVDIPGSSIVVDIEFPRQASYVIEAYFMSRASWAVYLPEEVVVSVSLDGSTYQSVGSLQQLTDIDGAINLYQLKLDGEPEFRYIKFDIDSVGAWFMCCELRVMAETASFGCQKILTGGFIQSWLCAYWTPQQWETELDYMQQVQMDHIIWNSIVSTDSNKCYYPSSLGYTQVGNDAVGKSLQAAQAKGMKVWLGLNFSEDWWTKFWIGSWVRNEFQISKDIAKELWDLYGAQYGDTIAGFYLTYEVDSLGFRTSSMINMMREVYTDTCTYIHSYADKPVMIAPFFYTNLGIIGQSPKSYAQMWGEILSTAPIDIIAVQDGVGAEHTTLDKAIPYYKELRQEMIRVRPESQLWSDMETFVKTGWVPAPIDRMVDQLDQEAPYCDNITSFAFSHYQSPQQGHTAEFDAYKAYVDDYLAQP